MHGAARRRRNATSSGSFELERDSLGRALAQGGEADATWRWVLLGSTRVRGAGQHLFVGRSALGADVRVEEAHELERAVGFELLLEHATSALTERRCSRPAR